MTAAARVVIGIAMVIAIAVLAVVGERFAPPARAPVGGAMSTNQKCSVEAPESLHDAARQWCASGLFLKATITTNENTVVGVMQFTPNGAQTWELQSTLLITEFRRLTDQLFAAANGWDVGISLNDAGDRRVGGCARGRADAAALCTTK